jgi:hypothetical protein
VAKTGDTMSGALAITAAGTALRVTNHVAVGGTLTVGGNVGIGVAAPQAKLEVAGTIKGGGVLAGLWAAQPLTDVLISTSDTWQDVANTSVTFTLDRDATVFFTYSINVQPNGNPGGDWLGTRLMIDGTPQRESGSHFQPFTPADANTNLHGNVVRNLTKSTHTAVLQWLKGGATVGSWSSNPSWGDIGGRTLIVMAFYR